MRKIFSISSRLNLGSSRSFCFRGLGPFGCCGGLITVIGRRPRLSLSDSLRGEGLFRQGAFRFFNKS